MTPWLHEHARCWQLFEFLPNYYIFIFEQVLLSLASAGVTKTTLDALQIEAQGDGAFLTKRPAANNQDALVMSQDVLMLHQQKAATLSGSIEGEFVTKIAQLETAATAHRNIFMVLRTPIVYQESPYVVVLLWTAAPGFGPVSTKNVWLNVTHPDGIRTLGHNCGQIPSAEVR